MAYKADEVKVGLVIVVSLLILCGFIMAILGLKLGEPVDTFTTNVQFAGGIEPGTVVRFGGMQVGKVTEVGVSSADNARIQLALTVDKGVPIKTDSEIFINTIGFLGDYYLEISTGTTDAPLLPPESEIPSQEVASINDMLASAQSALEKVDAAMYILNEKILKEDLARLRSRVEQISEKIVKLLTDVDLIFSEENRTNVAQTLERVNALVQESREGVGATLNNFRTASEKLDSLAMNLDTLVGDNREDVDLLIDDIRATVAEMKAAAGKIEDLVTENTDDISVTIDNLKATTANTRDFSENIADDPWRVLWKTPQPEKKILEQKE